MWAARHDGAAAVGVAAEQVALLIGADQRKRAKKTDEPFGQRRFGFADPSGLWVDVVQQIEPAPGYWERDVSAPR